MTQRAYVDLEVASALFHEILDWGRREGVPMVFIHRGVLTARAAKREVGNAVGLNIQTKLALRQCDRTLFLIRWR